MSYHRYAGAEYALDRLAYFGAPFEFHGFGAALFHDAYCRVEGLLAVALIGAKRQVAYNQCACHTFHYRCGMVYHLVESHRQCRHIACHHIGCGVADEYHIHSGLVDEFGHGIIVGGEHSYLFATLLHFGESACGDLATVLGIS